MLVNYLMRPHIDSICWEEVEKIQLPDELNKIIRQGFTELTGCFLLSSLLQHCSPSSLDFFEDEIAFECFVNSIHMDDYVTDKYLSYTIVFCNFIMRKWNENHDENLNAIISLDDETLLPTIKFHVKRKNVSWLEEDKLDLSIQAVLITTEEINKISYKN